MAQCRKGWHLRAEPAADQATPSEEHKALLAVQANLVAAYAECREAGDELLCEQIAESGAELDAELRTLGVRGRLTGDPGEQLSLAGQQRGVGSGVPALGR